MEKIFMTKTEYKKDPTTKTTYFVDEVEEREISRTVYNNITSDKTLKFYRSLGGSETAQKSYTCAGYLTTRLTSVSPDKKQKNVYQFKFS